MIEARKHTCYGRKRLAWHLCREDELVLSPHTIRHILRRHGFTDGRKRFYPAHWTWEEERPFSLGSGRPEGCAGQGDAGDGAVGLDEEEETPPLPVDLLGGEDQAEVSGLELSSYPEQRSLFHVPGHALAEELWARGGGGLVNGLGGSLAGATRRS